MIKYEYKMIELELPAELSDAITRGIFGQPLEKEQRIQMNAFLEKQLNELGKNGWMLHNSSGLNTLPTLLVFRTKGVK